MTDDGWNENPDPWEYSPVPVEHTWVKGGNQDGWDDELPSQGTNSTNSGRNWNNGGRNNQANGGWNDTWKENKQQWTPGNQSGRGGEYRKRDNWRDSSTNKRTERGNTGSQLNYLLSQKLETLYVANRYVGRVIGRFGAKIAELQSYSGAKISVTKDIKNDETAVTLIGTDDAISKAKDLIKALTTEKTFEPVETKPIPEAPKRVFVDMATFLKESEEAEKAEWAKYPPVKKQFYREHPEVTKMTATEVEDFRADNNNIMVSRTFENEKSAPIPKPCPSFYFAFYDYPEILDEIKKAGFETPSPIQAQAWPVLLSGEDLIGIAQTGTGKTLAFLLPAMIHIDGQITPRHERGGPAVLIMAPTRELAIQIHHEVEKYQYRGITSTCIYGGASRSGQAEVIKKGVDIVIATPGRMNDLHDAGHLNVKTVTYVVLDEADKMLDMGFEPQIRRVMYSIRPTRQTVMTSATWPDGVRRLAISYMNDPVQICVGTLDLAASHTVTQTILMMSDKEGDKYNYILDFVTNLGPDQKVIIFCGRKARVVDMTSDLQCSRIKCDCLYGDKPQEDREQAVTDIKSGKVNILIATDLASRGLDIDDVTHVINYDFPKNIEEYVHRIGRTGRAGKYGESISLFTKNDWAQASHLIKILEEAQQFVPGELYDMAARYSSMQERKNRDGTGPSRFGGRTRRW